MRERFTIDGSEDLEKHLAQVCDRVLAGVESTVGSARLEALVLGGGYGRGEGGVLRLPDGDHPYNDLEFYVFTRGNRLVDDLRFRSKLAKLGEKLSPGAGLHVEFKVESLKRLRDSAVSMFSYDLVSQNRIIFGERNLFETLTLHRNSAAIPLSEATRLLFNRCSGLLLARELLEKQSLSRDDSDFIGRNIAKAQMSLGDAVLTAFGRYHWSCRERRQALLDLQAGSAPEWQALIEHHREGVEFKLHPRPVANTREELKSRHRTTSLLAERIWMWVEAKRLNQDFVSPTAYALHQGQKCPDQRSWKNYLLSLRTFGAPAAFDRRACRYPRERLFNSLPLLLWSENVSRTPGLRKYLQRQLHSEATDWTGLVGAYKQVWSTYG